MVGAVPEFAELVDGLPVAVAGQGARAGGVVEAVQHAVRGEFVEPVAQPLGGDLRGLGVVRGEFAQGGLDLVRADLHLVDLAQAVHRAQDPQVGDVVVAAGEVEQPEAVTDRERVQIQSPALGHRRTPVFSWPVPHPRVRNRDGAIVAATGDGPGPGRRPPTAGRGHRVEEGRHPVR